MPSSRYLLPTQIPISTLSPKSQQNSLNEIRFLASFQCKNIIRYHHAFFEPAAELLVIVMEFAEEGDLGRLIELHRRQTLNFS
jgi:NIMA (never in mitosis gene a)-related kinase